MQYLNTDNTHCLTSFIIASGSVQYVYCHYQVSAELELSLFR